MFPTTVWLMAVWVLALDGPAIEVSTAWWANEVLCEYQAARIVEASEGAALLVSCQRVELPAGVTFGGWRG